MQIDVTFNNGKVYDVQKSIDVLTGTGFTLEATDLPDGARWFADKDEVLDIAVEGSSAAVQAKAEGASTILILNQDYSVAKRLEIKVVASFVKAELLNVSSLTVSK